LICAGMPSSRSFTALLDGAWARGGWLGPAVEAAPVADEAASEFSIDPPLAADEAMADEGTAISRDAGGAVAEASETPLPGITPLPRDEKDGPAGVAG
jgi:hypothetical protein